MLLHLDSAKVTIGDLDTNPLLASLRAFELLAKRTRAKKLGLWKACPRTPYDLYHGVQTRR